MTKKEPTLKEGIQQYIDQLSAGGFNAVKTPENVSFGTIEESRELLKETFQAVDKTIKPGAFQWLPEYEKVSEWLVNNEGKGLALIGSSGRGKSIILYRVLPILFKMLRNKSFPHGLNLKPVPAFDLSKTNVWEFSKRPAFAIDELGREPRFNDYGEKYEALDYIIDNAERDAKLLFFTSNSKPKGIQDRYGPHFMDRLRKLCLFIEFIGPSLRK